MIFSMAIAGVPSMVNDFTGGSFMETHYHSQFDKVYKARQGNKITMTNIRGRLIEVDPYNYIWLQTCDYRVYRFDQRTEKFEQSLLRG